MTRHDSERWIESNRLGWLVLTFSWLLISILYILVQRDTTFAVDELDWIGLVGSRPLPTLIEPLNGHLIALPLAVFRVGLEVFGTSHLGFTITELLFLFSVSLGLYVFSRRRLGPMLAIGPAVLPLTLGAGWPLLSAPLIGIEWAAAITFGLWALIAIEQERRNLDALACVLLILSLSSFSIGIPFLIACAIAVAQRPSRWHRSWIVIVPAAVYGGWYLWAHYDSGGVPIDPRNVLWLPAYVMDSLIAVFAATAGFNLDYGPGTTLGLEGFDRGRFVHAVGFALLLVLLLSWSIRRIARSGRAVVPLLVVLSIPLSLWVSQGILLDEFRRPIEYRYLFGSTVVVMLVLAEIFRGVDVTAPRVLTSLFVVAVSALMSLAPFNQGRNSLLVYSREAKANMTALELAGANADPSFMLSDEKLTPQAQFMFLNTGEFLAMSDRYGSPSFSISELRRQPDPIRQAADITLARALSIRLEPAPLLDHRCRRVVARQPGSDVVAGVPSGIIGIRSTHGRQLFLGRFSDSEAVGLGWLEGGASTQLRIPTDNQGRKWRIRATGRFPITLCSNPAD